MSERVIFWTLMAGGALFLGSKAYAALKSDIPNSPRRVACLGDSLTANGRYCAQLQDYLPTGSYTKAFGFPGKGAQYIYQRFDDVLAWGPTDIVILAGVNDMPRKDGANRAISALKKLYAKARVHGIRVVAAKLTPWFCASSAYGHEHATEIVNDWIGHDALVDKTVDTYALGDGRYCLNPKYDGGDGLHLNQAGQDKLAQLIAKQAFRW